MATDKVMQAVVRKVPIGHLSIEGLKGEDGNFYVAVPQLTKLSLIRHNQASRDLKSLLGADLSIRQAITQLHFKPVNVIPLEQFRKVLRALDKKGVEAAGAFLDALEDLSLHQLFCDAHGDNVTPDDRQAYLKVRQEEYKPTRKALKAKYIKVLKEFPEQVKWDDKNKTIAFYTNEVYRAFFGISAQNIRAAKEVPAGELTRDYFTSEEGEAIWHIEAMVAKKLEQGKTIAEAVKEATDFWGKHDKNIWTEHLTKIKQDWEKLDPNDRVALEFLN